MIFLAAFLGAVLWFLLIAMVILLRQTPKAYMHRRMEHMIREAEQEREEAERRKAKAAIREETAPVHRSFEEIPFRERVLRPLVEGIEAGLVQLTPKELKAMIEQQIFCAGKQDEWSVNRLASCWMLSIGLGFLLGLLVVRNTQELQLPQGFAVLLLGAAAGAVIPYFLLQSTIRRRRADLRRQLPEFLDLLCVSVQAGLSFDGAVSKIIGRMKGPLVEEFQRMQRDTSLGMVRQRSLMQLAKRCDIEEVYLFVTSVVQAERLGTSMARTLKLQADNMRDRHRQYVRGEAMKAPIKILFPLILFIFPSIFVLTLFPVFLTLIRSFGN